MSNSNLRLPVLPKAAPSSPSVEAEPSVPNLEVFDGEAREEGLMQIGDLAREAGKTVRAIHLYEELDLLKPAARSKGRFRLYGRDALVRIRWIGKLQEMGFSLGDIQSVVKDWEKASSAPRAMVRMREVYKQKLEETRSQIKRLVALEHEMEASLKYLDTCEVCDPERLLSACTHCDMHACEDRAPDLVAGFRAQRLAVASAR